MTRYLFWTTPWIFGALSWVGLKLGINKSFDIYPESERVSTLQGCGVILIDSSYHLYTRNVCRPRPSQAHYRWRGEQRPEAGTGLCNCDGVSDQLELLEREYLLVSILHGNVIGIMPYPPYVKRGQNRGERIATYLYDKPLFKTRPDLINLWWANRFHFGKIGSDMRTVTFRHKNDRYANLWRIRFENNDLVIDSVIWTRDKGKQVCFASSAAAGFPSLFRRQPNGYVLGFQEDTEIDYDTARAYSYAVQPPYKLHIDRDGNSKSRYLVHFEIMRDDSDEVAIASFQDPSIASSPELLLDVPFHQ